MSETTLVIYQQSNALVPLLDWLDKLPWKVKYKCLVKVDRLGRLGRELRRPDCDYLEAGIRELRIRKSRVNYRILYAFIPRSQNAVLLSHGCTKEKAVPAKEIERAKQNLENYMADPAGHTYQGEILA